MVRMTQKIQVLLRTDKFNVVCFANKGKYFVKVALVVADQNQQLSYAYPELFELNHQNHQDKAYVRLKHFNVTYERQVINMPMTCLFQFQVELNHNPTIYMQFQLNTLSYTKEYIQKVEKLDCRRIYLAKYRELDCYERIIFTQLDYFSYVDIYLCSVAVGHRLRLFNFQKFDFASLTEQQKYKNQTINQAYLCEQKLQDKLQQQYEHYKIYNPETFFQLMVNSYLKEFHRIRNLHQRFKKYFPNKTQLKQNIKKIDWFSQMAKKNTNQLLVYYQVVSLPQLYNQIIRDSRLVEKNVLFVWRECFDLLKRLGSKIFKDTNILNMRTQKSYKIIRFEPILTQNVKAFRNKLFSEKGILLKNQNIYQQDMIHHPILFFEGNKQQPQRFKDQNTILKASILIVFVHGFQGSKDDLQKAKNFITMYNPKVEGLIIREIDSQDMEKDLEHLGQKVAKQVIAFIKGSSEFKSINFIGFSMGGLLVRECLPYLQQYKDKFNYFCTFGTPHLGTSQISNYLVRTGIWYLANLGNIKVIQQMHDTLDNQENNGNKLKMLSKCQSLSWFNKVVVVSSIDDNFVPYSSSRLDENASSNITKEMCLSIKQNIKHLERIEVWFDYGHYVNTFDQILGRRAHIEFLENRIFLQMFAQMYAPFF